MIFPLKTKGREVGNSSTDEYFHLISTCHDITSKLYPQANGLVEHQNRMTEEYIWRYADEGQNWLELLNGILFSVHLA